MNFKAEKNLFKYWLKFEDVLGTFQPRSRRGKANTYCRTKLEGGISDSEDHRGQCSRVFHRIDECKNMDQMKHLYPCHYRKLNIQSYFRWVRLMTCMFAAAESAAAVSPGSRSPCQDSRQRGI